MKKSRAGFTLIELSIVLAILGILTAGGLTIGGVLVDQQRFTDSNTRVDEARRALVDYFKLNGRLPCVAPQDIAMGATGYGTELASCANGAAATGATIRVRADGSACTASATDANCVRIGALPVRTLGLSDAAAADDYGNKLFYAVTEDMTDATKVTAALGRISIIDGLGATIATGTGSTGAAFSVISPGPDGKGAYKLLNGVQTSGCGGSGLDLENCNNDAVFRDTQFNNGNQAANFYDDIPTWVPKYILTTATNVAATNSLWAETGTNIYATGSDNDVNTGNVGIGTTNPSFRFDVQQTRTETSGGSRYYVARNYMNVAPSAASSALQTALVNGCDVTTTTNITGDVLCNYNAINKTNAGSLANAYGGYSEVRNTASGSISTAYGAVGSVYNTGSGTITNAFALITAIGNSGSGAITNGYGLFINDVQATNQWGVYQGGVDDSNYFAGNVGIGTTNPSSNNASLRVARGQNASRTIDSYSYSNNSYNVYAETLGAGSIGVYSYMPAGAQGTAIVADQRGNNSWGVYGYTTGANSNGVYGDSYGANSNAVIGITSASATSSIAGNFIAYSASSHGFVAQNTSSNYYCYIGYLNTYALLCNGPNNIVSDRREKKEIETLARKEGLESVMRLRPVHYMWKDDRKNATGKKQTGFIAQEVEKVFPSLVGVSRAPGTPGKDGKVGPQGPERKVLEYTGLIAPTVLAVQQLKREKDALELRVKSLEAKLGAGGAGRAEVAIDTGVFGIAYKQLAMLLSAMLLGVFGSLVVRRK